MHFWKRLGYALILRLPTAFGDMNKQDYVKAYVAHPKWDPFNGKGKEVKAIIERYFGDGPEGRRTLSYLERRSKLRFDTEQTADRFFHELEKLGLFFTYAGEESEPHLFSMRDDWYYPTSSLFNCSEHGFTTDIKWADEFSEDERPVCNVEDCGEPVTRTCDMRPKEVNNVAEEEFLSTIGELIDEVNAA